MVSEAVHTLKASKQQLGEATRLSFLYEDAALLVFVDALLAAIDFPRIHLLPLNYNIYDRGLLAPQFLIKYFRNFIVGKRSFGQ